MLNSKLIVKTTPKADERNMVFWQDYRVTVLAERLFRIEKSPNLHFRDEATQAVWYRDMPKVDFKVSKEDGGAVIETAACRLILHKERTQVCVEFENKRVKLDNYGNLLGTYRTLDCCNGDLHFKPWVKNDVPYRIQLENGVCSKTGVAVLDDSSSLMLGADGQVKNEKADGSDEYVFVYGDDYRAAVKALYMITGKPSLVPRFALGNWWSRYHVYTDEEYLRVLNRFADKNIPISVATVDMDWHYSEKVDEEMKITECGFHLPEYVGEYEVNLGWTGYTWNKTLFPNPTAFLNELHERGMKVTLNVHPSDGFRFWEECYKDMATALGVDDKQRKQIPFDFSYSLFINAYFEIGHQPLENGGVDFWWIDWQQKDIPWHEEGKNACSASKYDPLWALNHYHYVDNASKTLTPMILSRYAGVGSHRYPVGFSGDTEISWKTLAYLPYFTATASNIGYTWWSHDIGGHNFGEKSDELFVRHLQFGVFSPINRLHCTNDDTMTKEPWAYKNGAGLIAEEFLRFRHKLVPYLYTANYKCFSEGIALIEPLYYEWKEEKAYAYPAEYRFGSELLVIPATQRAETDGYTRICAWLPEGVWTDIFTGDVYEIGEGGEERTLLRTLDSIPVLAKWGAILPLSLDHKNEVKNPEKLEICVFEGTGFYTLYEDGLERKNRGSFYTDFQSKYTQTKGVCTQSLTISAHGNEAVIPQNRTLKIVFKGVQNGEVSLLVDGVKTTIEKRLSECLEVEIAYSPLRVYQIEVSYPYKNAMEKRLQRAKRILTEGEGANPEKQKTWTALSAVTTLQEMIDRIDISHLDEIVKQKLKETL